jgi:hypothetical protein
MRRRVIGRWGVAGEQSRYGDLEAMRAVVVAAALRYRDVMRAYMVGQATALEQGATLDALVLRSQAAFAAAAQAEEVLFSLLDTLEAMETSGEIVIREQAEESGCSPIGGPAVRTDTDDVPPSKTSG